MNISRLAIMAYVVSHKRPVVAVRSRPTLPFQRRHEHLSRSPHGRAMPTLVRPSALVINPPFRHLVAPSDVPFTAEASVLAEHANAFRGGDDYGNSHLWSPTVLRKRKRSPVPIVFQLSSRKTLLSKEDQRNALQSFPSGQVSKPSCNQVICHRQLRHPSDSIPLHRWLACIMFEIVLRSDQRDRPRPPVCCKAVAEVAMNLKRLFRVYSPHDEVIFMALWYASYMMPHGLLDQFDRYQPHGIILATRLFVLGYTLAVKWLVDDDYWLWEWVPYYTKEFSVSCADALEKAALKLLDYNLYISPSDWTTWLHELNEGPPPNAFVEDRDHFVAQASIRKLLFKAKTSSPSSYSRSIPTSVTAIWKVHNILLDNLGISIALPEPAPWKPSEDPIIHATGRRQPFFQAPPPWSYGNNCSVPLLWYPLLGSRG